MITLAALLLLLFAGLYLGLLILVLFLAIRAKTVGGRIVSIAAGVLLLLVVPLFFVLATFTLRPSSMETASTSVTTLSRDRTPGSEAGGPVTLSGSMAVVPPLSADPPAAFAPAARAPTARAPTALAPAAPLPVDGHLAAGTWTATETQPLKADVYPSYSAAIVSQLSSLRETLIAKEILQRDDQDQVVEPESVSVTGDASSIETMVVQSTEMISKQFPGVEVRSKGKGWPDSATNQLSVHLSLANVVRQIASWGQGTEQTTEHALLTFEIQLDKRHTSFQCFVTEKPWVESFDRFVSMYPKRRFVVGYSSGLHSSEGQARKAAMDDAIRQAAITVNGRAFSIINERHVVDRFAQRLTRSYGEVWREAVLIEVPDSNQVGVARARVDEEFRRSAMGQVSQYVAIAILVIVTVLLCLLLNWGTKGYYRGRVLLGLTSVVIAGFLFAALFVS